MAFHLNCIDFIWFSTLSIAIIPKDFSLETKYGTNLN